MTDQFETLAVHAGADPDPLTGGVSPAIEMSATFKQDAVGETRGGFEYGRSDNPTRRALESAIAALESGTHGLAYASGLAATQNLLYLLRPGDRLLLSDDAYGGTWRLASKVWTRYRIETEAIDLRDLDAVAAALSDDPRGSRRRPTRSSRLSTSAPCRALPPTPGRSPWSTTRSPPRSFSVRWSSERTWCCTLPPSTWAAIPT